jgi:hypothetical protein
MRWPYSFLLWQALAWLLCWAGGALAPQHSPEDLTVYQIAQRAQAHASWPAHFATELAIDRKDANRFRPVYVAALTTYVRWQGTDLQLWNALMAVLLGLSGWLLLLWLRRLGFSLALSWLGAALCVLGPQTEAWQLFTYQEGLALPLFLLGMLALPGSCAQHAMGRLAGGTLLLLLAGATKEVFLLAIPFASLVAGLSPTLPLRSRRWWVYSLLMGAYMLAMLLYIRATVSTTHAGVYGFSLWQTTPQRFLTALWQLLGQHHGIWLGAQAALWGLWLWRRPPLQPTHRTVLLAAGALILPQVLIYTLSGFEWPRYLLPANLGLVLLTLVPAHALWGSTPSLNRGSWFLAGGLSLLLLWPATLQLRQWSSYASGIYAAQQTILQLPPTAPLTWVVDGPDAPFELPYWHAWATHARPLAPPPTYHLLAPERCNAQDFAELARLPSRRIYEPIPGTTLCYIGSVHGRPWAAVRPHWERLLPAGADTLCKAIHRLPHPYDQPHNITIVVGPTLGPRPVQTAAPAPPR